jgi:hypothetical protein
MLPGAGNLPVRIPWLPMLHLTTPIASMGIIAMTTPEELLQSVVAAARAGGDKLLAS